MSREANLPSYATLIAKGKVEADAEQFYPAMLKELKEFAKGGIEGHPPFEVNQYWLQVALGCVKRDISIALANTDDAPDKGGALVIIVKDRSKSEGKDELSTWALARYPEVSLPGTAVASIWKNLRGLLI